MSPVGTPPNRHMQPSAPGGILKRRGGSADRYAAQRRRRCAIEPQAHREIRAHSPCRTGWSCSVSRWIEYTGDDQLIEDVSISPCVFVTTTAADFSQGAIQFSIGR